MLERGRALYPAIVHRLPVKELIELSPVCPVESPQLGHRERGYGRLGDVGRGAPLPDVEPLLDADGRHVHENPSLWGAGGASLLPPAGQVDVALRPQNTGMMPTAVSGMETRPKMAITTAMAISVRVRGSLTSLRACA